MKTPHPAVHPRRLFTILLLVLCSFAELHTQSAGAPSGGLTLGTKSLNFLVLSDWGREGIDDVDKKTPGQLKAAHQLGITADEIKASFVVTCGDNFHGKGVPSAMDPLWNVNFENVYSAPSLMIPWYPALGNHDYEGNVEAEVEYAKTSRRWHLPARYYAISKSLPDSTAVLFVVLDSSPFVDEYINDSKDAHHVGQQNRARQVQWCDSVLSTTKATWKFAVFHHPAYSAGSKHGSTIEIQKLLVPMFERYQIDAVFSGHDHDLQHSHPEGTRIDYFGNGGGSETRPVGTAAFTKFSKASLGFGAVSLTRHLMRFSFVDEKGEVIYSYDIRK